MASVSVSHLILFIASMVIAVGVAGVFTTSVDDLSQAIDDRGVQVSDDVRTDIEIISDSGSDNVYEPPGVGVDDGTITILVKNTGSQSLDPEPGQVDVLVNGEFVTADELSLTVLGDGDEDTWDRAEVLEVSIERTLEAGDHRVLVVVSGNEEPFEFRVEDDS